MPSLISFSFNSLTSKNIGTFTNNVVQQMKADAQFMQLKPEVDSLSALYDAFWSTYNDALKGGSDRILLRDTRKEAMRAQLYKTALLAEVLADSNPAVITAAGFELRKTTRTAAPPVSTPTNLKGEKGDKNGSVALSWKGAAGSTSFDIQCLMPNQTEWKTIKHTTLQSITIYGFELGQKIEFRISANGRGEEDSDWTEPIAVWTTNV